MLKNCVAILSIGSSNINLIVGERSVNNTFTFRANVCKDFYAFNEGEFDIKGLETQISNMFLALQKSSEVSSISKIYVGVPGEFCKTINKNYKITFNTNKKITNKEVKGLFDLAYEDVEVEYSLMHRSAVYFKVDDLKVDSPIGKRGTSLSGRLYFALVSNYFKDAITNVLKKCKVETINFISEDYAESQYLFSPSEKNNCKILIDIGSFTTSFSISTGGGLLFSSAFPLGGGLITAYLYEKFNCDYYVAELLKRKINFGLSGNYNENYLIYDDNGVEHLFSVKETNEVARDVIDKIAESFEKLFSTCSLKIPSDTDTYFTGGGLSYIRGAIEYISSRIGVLPKVVSPTLPHYNEPKYSARYSLLDTALNVRDDKIFFIK